MFSHGDNRPPLETSPNSKHEPHSFIESGFAGFTSSHASLSTSMIIETLLKMLLAAVFEFIAEHPILAQICFIAFVAWRVWQHLPEYLEQAYTDLVESVRDFVTKNIIWRDNKHCIAETAIHARNKWGRTPTDGSGIQFKSRAKTRFFRYKSSIFMFTEEADGDVKVWAFCRTVQPIQDFLNDVHREGERNKKVTEVNVYGVDFENHFDDLPVGWKKQPNSYRRSMGSVCLPSKVKMRLTKSIERFLHPLAPGWYERQGRPYRQGYLLYGPPGCGKTSFARAVATEYDFDIYCLSLADPRINDDTLKKLFRSIHSKCLVLLDDIDCSGIERGDLKGAPVSENYAEPDDSNQKTSVDQTIIDYNDREDVDDGTYHEEGERDYATEHWAHSYLPSRGSKRTKDRERGTKPTQRLTRSGLLNAIDGVCTPTGYILIMTTNFPEKLDPVLIRPGRIDYRIEFTYANREQCHDIFMGTMTPFMPDDLATFNEAKLQSLAHQFSEKVPELTISPATVQQYCHENIDDPEGAVDGVEEWLKKEQEEKQKIANYAQESNVWSAESAGK